MRAHVAKSKTSVSGVATKKHVGVRELKANAARILRQVRDKRESYILTHRGRAIGVILPLEAPTEASHSLEDSDAAWAEFLDAGRSLQFRRGASALRELSAMRR